MVALASALVVTLLGVTVGLAPASDARRLRSARVSHRHAQVGHRHVRVSRRLVQAVFVYRFDDLGGDVRNPEGYYGPVRRDGNPKPALSMVRAEEHLGGS